MSGFDLNSFCDNLDDDYGIFEDVVDSLDFTSVGISTVNPDADKEDIREDNKNNNVKLSLVKGTKRGRKKGQKPTCGLCGVKGHTKRKCTK
tara:strand:+ start:269 stop:541 length:273 start_codon:yes stop_codon:yes gene_type:complete